MIRLHYYPGNASMAPHIVLRELGVPFELELVDRTRDAQRSSEYLRLNPNGTIPVLVDGDLVMHETAAILLHLADTHADAALSPPLGSADRAQLYKWLFWLSNTLQATLMVYVYPDRWVSAEADSGSVKTRAQKRIGEQLDLLGNQLQSHGGPWLLGQTFSVADPLAFMLCRWTRNFDPAIAAPARARPTLHAYLQRMLARPSVQRVLTDEKLAPPAV